MPALQPVLGTWCSLLCLSWNSSTQCDHTDRGLCHQEVTQELGLATYPLEHSFPISRCNVSYLPPEQSRVASPWVLKWKFAVLLLALPLAVGFGLPKISQGWPHPGFWGFLPRSLQLVLLHFVFSWEQS